GYTCVLAAAGSVAAAVTMGAPVVSLRAGRGPRRAADLVPQLLEPPVVVGDVVAAVPPPPAPAPMPTAPMPTAPAAAPPVTPVPAPVAPPVAPAPVAPVAPVPAAPAPVAPAPAFDPAIEFAPESDLAAPAPRPAPPVERRAAPSAPPGGAGSDREPGQARIPVFDLDRLRWWLTDGDVTLGRIAVMSVELDNLAHVNERLGYKAGEHLIEAITTRLRAVTRPRDVVAHVNPERFVLVCRDVPDHAPAEALADRIPMPL